MRVLVNAVVRTMDTKHTIADAIAWEAGRIIAVGDRLAVVARAGAGAEVEDVGGRAIVPGFIDAHHHLSMAALYESAVDCRPAAARSIAEMRRRFAARAAELRDGDWVVGFGYDEWRIEERRHPTRSDLDAACGDRPALLVHFSFHELVASSAALAAAGIGRNTTDPPAGEVERDRHGEPTGRLIETAGSTVIELAERSLVAQSGDDFLERLERYERRLLACGITRVADPAVPPEIERVYAQAIVAGKLRIPVLMMPVGQKGHLVHPWDRLDGPPTGQGTDELRLGPLKLFFDGANRCAMNLSVGQAAGALVTAVGRAVSDLSVAHLRALVREPLRRDRGRLRSGVLYYGSPDEARKMVDHAVARGFAVAIHAIGNEAFRQAVDVLASVGPRHPGMIPPRIEHGLFVSADLARRAADAGIAVVTQPHFLALAADSMIPALPGLDFVPLRTLLDAGVCVAASSDAPVAAFEPLLGIASAVTRTGCGRGSAIAPRQAVSAEEALRMYTREAARALGCLHAAGTLEVGKRADLVVLSRDPCATPPDEIAAIRVEQTVLGGEAAHRAR